MVKRYGPLDDPSVCTNILLDHRCDCVHVFPSVSFMRIDFFIICNHLVTKTVQHICDCSCVYCVCVYSVDD